MLSAREKKRIRDRRAQQALRQKRDKRIQDLERKVAFCDRYHNAGAMQRMLDLLGNIRCQIEESPTHNGFLQNALCMSPEGLSSSNQKLLDQMFDILMSWKTNMSACYDEMLGKQSDPLPRVAGCPQGTPEATDASLQPQAVSSHSALPHSYANVAASTTKMLNCNPNPTMDISNLVYQSMEPKLGAMPAATPIDSVPVSECIPGHPSDDPTGIPSLVPAWMLPPFNESMDSAISKEMYPWLASPELIKSCPDRPCPLSLLHGSRRNYLADSIYQSLRHRNCRPPELLAIGWLIYTYCKWRVCLTAELYNQLPIFFRPVMGQLRSIHPHCIDLIIWPQMRLNLISQWENINVINVTGLLSCCLKVRWSWTEDILELDDRDTLHIRKDFYERFMSEAGWGLTSEFIQQYPTFLQGMDVSRLLYTLEP